MDVSNDTKPYYDFHYTMNSTVPLNHYVFKTLV